MPKIYDEAYFNLWYRERGFHDPANVKELATGIVEVVKKRHGPVRRILDVGCGEGRWRRPLIEAACIGLRATDPCGYYIGFDPSEYAIGRYGKERNLRRRPLAQMEHVGACSSCDVQLGHARWCGAETDTRWRSGVDEAFDLILCMNVLEYLDLEELQDGLAGLVRLCRGIAHFFVVEDNEEGDGEGWHRRPFLNWRDDRPRVPAISWRDIFERTGWVPLLRYKHFYIPKHRAFQIKTLWSAV